MGLQSRRMLNVAVSFEVEGVARIQGMTIRCSWRARAVCSTGLEEKLKTMIRTLFKRKTARRWQPCEARCKISTLSPTVLFFAKPSKLQLLWVPKTFATAL